MAMTRTVVRIAFILSLMAQTGLLAAVVYLFCGATGPVDGLPECHPWVPRPILEALPSLLGALGFPAMNVIPQFSTPATPFIPGIVREWAWLVVIATVNVLIWTCSVGGTVAVVTRWRAPRSR